MCDPFSEGPDWKSRLRPIPSPHYEDYPAEENWPAPWKPLRTFASKFPGKTLKNYFMTLCRQTCSLYHN